jgi:exportin-1
MFAMIINKLKSGMVDHVPSIFNATFECTLNMIKGNYVDYPEHRLQFFSLLQAITNHTFHCLRAMSPQQQQLLIDSIVWAFRHTERNVADTGLSLLNDLILRFIQEQDLLGGFCKAYYCRLLGEIFAVMTDTMHKPGFRQQVRPPQMHVSHCLRHLCGVIRTDFSIRLS